MTDRDQTRLREAVAQKPTLNSIFPRISISDKKDSGKRPEVPLPTGLLASENIVAPAEKLSPDALEADFARLTQLHPEAQSETFGYLLQKHGWRIGKPGTGEFDAHDVAFCDQIRVEKALEKSGEGGKYLLVKGDLSGIQEYIYGGIQPKNAGGQAGLSKKLRGRSALVAMLTDFLAGAMLHELGLSHWHLLFAGGGHFNLLLPFSLEMETNLDIVSEKIGHEMHRNFGDTLDLVVAWIECDANIRDNAGQFFEKLNARREAKKHRLHHKSLSDHFYPSADSSRKSKEERDNLAETLGRILPNRSLLVETISSGEILDARNRAQEVFHFHLHDRHYQLFLPGNPQQTKLDSIEAEWNRTEDLLLDDQIERARVFKTNDTSIFSGEADWGSHLKMPVSFGFRFFGKNVPLEQNGDPKTFEKMAEPEPKKGKMTHDERRKNGLLASMRLDVDDLGLIFSHGLRPTDSLERLVCLSREMHYFFTAHFDRLAHEYGIYVIYSGGDDAFVVGRWDKVVAFAGRLQSDFQGFVQKSADVHFSAGIHMGDPKYPVERFFRDAKRQEDAAKEAGKSCVSIFDRIIRWERYGDKIKFGGEIFDVLEKPDIQTKRKLTMAFFYRILQLVKTSFHERTGIDEFGNTYRRGRMNFARFGRNVANIRYLFARHGYSQEEAAKIGEGVEKHLATDFLNEFMFGQNDEKTRCKTERLRDYLVAFNYALLSLRYYHSTHQHGK